MQQDLFLTEYDVAQTDYKSLESRLDLQELWSLIEVDLAKSVRLND
jgi:hypothetical protein